MTWGRRIAWASKPASSDRRSPEPHPRGGAPNARRLARRARRARLSRPTDSPAAVATPYQWLERGHRSPGVVANGARPNVSLRAFDAAYPSGVERWNGDVSVVAGGRRSGRVGADCRAQAPHTLHLFASRMRAGVRLLLHRTHGIPPQSLARRDRGPGSRNCVA